MNSYSSSGISPVIIAYLDFFFLLVSFQFSNDYILTSSVRFFSVVSLAAFSNSVVYAKIIKGSSYDANALSVARLSLLLKSTNDSHLPTHIKL